MFKNNKIFLIPFFLFLALSGVLIWQPDKFLIHQELTFFHTPFLDFFFRYFTELGNGITATVICLILLFVKYRYAIAAGLANILVGVVVQSLKLLVFTEYHRPLFYAKDFQQAGYELILAEGCTPVMHHSFPSGHTATAFATFFFLSIIAKNKALKFAFFLLALLAGYSRIYLSFHFLQDVFFGAIIGVLIAGFCWWIFESKAKWGEGSLLRSAQN